MPSSLGLLEHWVLGSVKSCNWARAPRLQTAAAAARRPPHVSGGGSCLRLFLVRSLPLQGLPCPSHPFLGSEDPQPGPRVQGRPCNRSLGRMWPRHRREAGTCGGRVWQRAPRTARPGGGASRARELVREGVRPAPAWGPAKCAQGAAYCWGRRGSSVTAHTPRSLQPNQQGRSWRLGGLGAGTFQGLPPSQTESNSIQGLVQVFVKRPATL